MSKNRFMQQPNVRIPRASFDLSEDWIGTMSLGSLYPVYWKDILPGDSFKIESDVAVRLAQNFKKPIFADLYYDEYVFKIPNRLVFKDSDKVFADAEPNEYTSHTVVNYPVVPDVSGSNTKSCYPGSIADNMGIPPYTEFGTTAASGKILADITLLPFRAYALVWNNWFRDENITSSTLVQTGNAVMSEGLNNSPWGPGNYTGMLAPVSKYHDYFTSCLPSPQKGPAAQLLGSNFIPLTTNGSTISPFPAGSAAIFSGAFTSGTTYRAALSAAGATQARFGYTASDTSTGTFNPVGGSNLGIVPNVDMNQFRFTLAYQNFLQRLATGGSRYTEFINAFFGVTSPDARLMIPEYVGGRRIRLNIQQVAQTAPGSGGAADVGNLQGYSLTAGQVRCSFASVEHGIVLAVACIRSKRLYQQGLERKWTRKNRDDFYNPIFAHLGEMPVKSSELYATAAVAATFGFNEAWADYRFGINKVVGQMRSQNNSVSPQTSLDIWHTADFYASAPVLTSAFVNENPSVLNRTIVNQANDQFIVHISHKVQAIRPLPLYSIPKLVG